MIQKERRQGGAVVSEAGAGVRETRRGAEETAAEGGGIEGSEEDLEKSSKGVNLTFTAAGRGTGSPSVRRFHFQNICSSSLDHRPYSSLVRSSRSTDGRRTEFYRPSRTA